MITQMKESRTEMGLTRREKQRGKYEIKKQNKKKNNQ
jgi:hypothetical protein